jgi:hypothetical protein
MGQGLSNRSGSVEVVRCYFDDAFEPHLPALCLRWEDSERIDRLWELPEGVCISGPPPGQFGFHVRRTAADAYAVRLLWDRSCFLWPSLRRVQLLSSALAPVLSALGTDLWYLLDQPVDSAGSGTPTPSARAA